MSEKRPFRFIKSLRLRAFIIVFLSISLPVTFLSFFVGPVYKNIAVKRDGQELLSVAKSFNNEIVSTGFLNGSNKPFTKKVDDYATSYSGRIMICNSSLSVVFDSFDIDEGKTLIDSMAVRAIHGEEDFILNEEQGIVTVVSPIINESGGIIGAIMIIKSIDYIIQNADSMNSILLITLAIVYAFAMLAGVLASIRLTRPLNKMSKSLDNLVMEYTSTVEEISDYTEVEIIAEKFNQVLQRLIAIDESRQEFVSNVSHELKTPLTSMKVLADSLNSGMDMPIEMYKEFMVDIGDEIDRETKIINDLLSLVRMDKKDSALEVTPVNINNLIEKVLKRLKPLADERDINLVMESFRPVISEVDEVKFTQILTNLIENAIKYNNDGGYVHVSLNSDHEFMYIRVEDNGLGIPEESLPYIFERFYRADKSHSREIGGTGLGLAITKAAIAQHRGEIKVHSTLGEGTTFDVRIPLSFIEKDEEI